MGNLLSIQDFSDGRESEKRPPSTSLLRGVKKHSEDFRIKFDYELKSGKVIKVINPNIPSQALIDLGNNIIDPVKLEELIKGIVERTLLLKDDDGKNKDISEKFDFSKVSELEIN